ncbi:MAG TPA: DUF805 domain-containing protein [Pseudolysinimonas sp.]|nr:DUF805 domain-containing protein [Pseudolysinimonas sp.]
MSFFDAIKTGFRKYADFTGRASRPEFWWWTLFTTLVSAALNALSVPTYGVMYSRIMSSRMMDDGPAFTSGYSSFSFAGLWGIAVLLPSLAVTVRRLRDAGRSWSELFWLLLPIAGVIILIVHLCEPSTAGGAAAGAAAAAETSDAPAAPVAPAPPPVTPVAPEAPAAPGAPAAPAPPLG